MATLVNDCGCCEGITAIVPATLLNRPGQPQVRYRAGTHGEFLASALAALSEPQFGALRELTTRDPDDFTIALLDAWAVIADVLTFYQERIANESYLSTATERLSLVQLAQHIGYRLKPGVAAETPLAFSLDETPGAPELVTVEIGTKVQSIPGAGEKAQTFETIEKLRARREWNRLRPLLTTPPAIAAGATSLYLHGTATNLSPGDAILVVGDERAQNPMVHPDKERWDFRLLLSVTPDPKNDRTHITWEVGLGKAPNLLPVKNVKVYAFRQLAARFGHNAPDPKLVTKPGGDAVGTWGGFGSFGSPMDLDNAYPKIVPRSWVAFANTDGYVQLYNLVAVSFRSRTNFALSGKVTHITLDTTADLQLFSRRETVVYAQSELLAMTSGPLITPAAGSLAASLTRDVGLLAPLEGSVIALDRLITPLAKGRKVIITGKPVRVRVARDAINLTSKDGLKTVTVERGSTLVLTARPTVIGNLAKWNLRTDEGFAGVVLTNVNTLVLSAARKDDATISEAVVIEKCEGNPSVLTLTNPGLTQLYDRETVTISANVADATHGETVSEVLGSSDAAKPNQRFELKQPPLTYVRSTRPGGAASSLQIRVNDLLWHEVSTLFEHQPRERIFTTELADDGKVTVRFGDGIRGARLPSGQQNVRATYRRGIGLEGLVRAGQLSTLLTRPPGLKEAINPLPAEGADEPESLADSRQNAPMTVLTLDRVVSLKDYEDFSRGYSGIAKALATWTWDGRTRGVFISVAGPRGAPISQVFAGDLIMAIHAAGDPFVPVRIESYESAYFRLSGQIMVDPDYETKKVMSAAAAALRAAFSFESRSFGQAVMLSEVIALVQAVPGVRAVNIKKLHRTDATAKLNPRLEAELPSGGDPAILDAAELLTLDPAALKLGVMP